MNDGVSSIDIKMRNKKEEDILKIIVCNGLEDSCKITPPQTSAQKWEMIELIKDDIGFIFGKNWKRFFLIENQKVDEPHHIQYAFNNPWQIAYEVWLSSKGYVDYRLRKGNCYLINAFSYDIEDKYSSESAINMMTVSFNEGYKIRERACMVIERNLRRSHPDLTEELTLYQYRDPNNHSSLNSLLVWKFDPILGDSENCVRIWSGLRI